jgi:intracellular sulfur oxidation DsrE/DsrF family protein
MLASPQLAEQGRDTMDRRWILRVLGAAAVILPVANRKADAYEKSSERHHRLAIHVDVNDPDVMKLALNNARNCHELYTEWGEQVEIEIVAYSQGLHMLRDDTSPVKEEIKALREKVPQVAFGACNNTKKAMEKREGKTITLIPEATLVPAGIVRLVELQELGYKYVKP